MDNTYIIMSIQILNIEKYASYTQNEKEMFEAYRDSMILLFPVYSAGYDDEVIELVENAAFIFVDKFPELVKNPPPPAPAVPATGGNPNTTTPTNP